MNAEKLDKSSQREEDIHVLSLSSQLKDGVTSTVAARQKIYQENWYA